VLRASITACIILLAATASCRHSARTDGPAVVEQSFRFQSAGEHFEAIIEAPAAQAANGWSVLLIGGGLGNDLHWSVPGEIEVEGESHRFTITGRPHEDAPRISRALAERGFTVARYSTISREDPLRNEWPLRATPRTLDELLRLARDALEAASDRTGIPVGRTILLGHSLGAARGVTLAAEEPRVPALILLAPAEVTDMERRPRSVRDSAMVTLGALLDRRDLPILIVFGGRDTSAAVDEGGVRALCRGSAGAAIDIRLFGDFGHQLGPVEDGLSGPIDAEVVAVIAAWAARLVAEGE
jgi:pimeloyl-ACP methyl ester carboxylesterase